MFKFYQIATDKQKTELEKYIDDDDTSKAWKLVQNVLGVKLIGKEFGN